MSEQIAIHPAARGVDDDGYPLPTPPSRAITVKSVQRVQDTDMSDEDRAGNIQVLRIWCAAGDEPTSRDDVTVRGQRYQVRTPGWDNGAHRRPALGRHRPNVVFEATRGEG